MTTIAPDQRNQQRPLQPSHCPLRYLLPESYDAWFRGNVVTLSPIFALCEGNLTALMNSRHKAQVLQSFDAFTVIGLNKQLNILKIWDAILHATLIQIVQVHYRQVKREPERFRLIASNQECTLRIRLICFGISLAYDAQRPCENLWM